MDLTLVWFILIAVLWTGYLVLEGFDYGVAMLMPIVGKNEQERRLALNTIGPVWDGNEVWLLTAGGATFAAFPEWYATLFSGFYLPLLLILLALIVRAVAIEYRGKINDPAWRKRWDVAIVASAWLPAVLWGVAFANLVRGIELDPDHQFFGGMRDLLSPFALLGGVLTATLFLAHGAIFLALKTNGEIRERAESLAKTLSLVVAVVGAAWAIWAQLAYSAAWTWVAVAVAAVGLVGAWITVRAGRFGWAFALDAVAIIGAVALIFGSMWPDVLPALNEGGNALTAAEASSSTYTLTVMTWVAGIMTPIVLAYQAWTYWVFRKRLSVTDLPEHREPVLRS